MNNSSLSHERFKKILKNFGSLAGAKSLGDLFTFLLFVFLSRTFGQEGIGQYSLAIALTAFFAVASEFGLYHYSIKELSRRQGPFGRHLGGILAIRAVLACASFGILLLILPWLSFSYETKLVIAVVGGYQIIYRYTNGLTAVFIAKEHMHVAALIDLSLKVLTTLLSIGIAWMGGSLVQSLMALPVVSIALMVVAFWIVTRSEGRLKLQFSFSYFVNTLRQAVPYAVASLLFVLSSRTDVVILSFVISTSAAGIYNVAYRFIFLLQFLAFHISMVLFPFATKLHVDAKKELIELYQKSMNTVVLVAFPIAGGLWLITPELMMLIFGDEFIESINVLRILTVVLFLLFLSHIMGVFLMACDRQVDRTKGYWLSACTNIIANLILIPFLGVEGAAFSAVVSEMILVFSFAYKLQPLLGWPRIGSRFILSTIAVLSFCLPLSFWEERSLIMMIPVAVTIYFSVLFMFKDIRQTEIRFIKELLLKR